MSVVLNGQRYEIPGLRTVSFADPGSGIPRTTKATPRRTWIRAIVFHTTEGIAPPVLPGFGPAGTAEAFARRDGTGDREASWDATVGADGTIAWSNDPITAFTWHAMQVNPYTIGIEIRQDPRTHAVYAGQLAAAVKLADWLSNTLPIQRIVPTKDGRPFGRLIDRCRSAEGAGKSVCGIYGHRNSAEHGERGLGDPGDPIFDALLAAGWRGVDYNAGEDLALWQRVQAELRVPVDGVPGPTTVAALERAGYVGGVWTPGAGSGPSPAGTAGPERPSGGGTGSAGALLAVAGASVALWWATTKL